MDKKEKLSVAIYPAIKIFKMVVPSLLMQMQEP